MSFSIFQNLKKSDIRTEPYPYVVVKNALNDKLYNELVYNFPKFNNTGSNIRLDYQSANINKSNHSWKKYCEYNCSRDFWTELLDIFGDEILKLHPDIENNNKLINWKTTVISQKSIQDFDIALETSASVNTASTSISRVRGPHLDNPSALYGGLLYMRDVNDDSIGGDFIIYKTKNNELAYCYDKSEINDDDVEVVEEVKYSANTLVFFINSNKSIHGVTNRSITKFQRRFSTLIGRCRQSLFELKRR